jgi:ribosomal protein RSM22 (predicted rRNA methylase)
MFLQFGSGSFLEIHLLPENVFLCSFFGLKPCIDSLIMVVEQSRGTKSGKKLEFMEIPYELRMAIERLTAGFAIGELKRSAQSLSLRYRTEGGNGKRLATQDDEAVAYAAARMPATYGAVYQSLKYALDLTECRPQSLLDAGAGTGAAAWAADALLDLERIVCLEREEAMIRIGRILMREAGPPALRNAEWIRRDFTADAIPGKADLVIASYALNELGEEQRMHTVEKLWNAAEIMLLLVEPGTPAGYSQMMKARDVLLKQGAQIAAPCPHENECPLPQGDWCHFKCRVPRSRLHRLLKEGEAPYEDEKFTYLAVTRQPPKRGAARVLRHPAVDKGRITLDLCLSDRIGKIHIYKKDGALFKQARKAKCGDVFTFR